MVTPDNHRFFMCHRCFVGIENETEADRIVIRETEPRVIFCSSSQVISKSDCTASILFSDERNSISSMYIR